MFYFRLFNEVTENVNNIVQMITRRPTTTREFVDDRKATVRQNSQNAVTECTRTRTCLKDDSAPDFCHEDCKDNTDNKKCKPDPPDPDPEPEVSLPPPDPDPAPDPDPNPDDSGPDSDFRVLVDGSMLTMAAGLASCSKNVLLLMKFL